MTRPLAACRQQMANQPYQQPLEAGEFFSDGMASRPAVPGTVPRGTDQDSESLQGEQAAGKSRDEFPFALTIAIITRGQERYNVYCAPCHDRTGYGEGMVVQRGFTKARSFHLPELRDVTKVDDKGTVWWRFTDGPPEWIGTDVVFNLTQKGNVLTGTAGPADRQWKIEKGVVDDTKVSFQVQQPDGPLRSFKLTLVKGRLTGLQTLEFQGQTAEVTVEADRAK